MKVTGSSLTATGIVAGYGEAIVLRDIHLTVPEGAITAIVGRNGVGKTTLVKTLMGLVAIRSGKIHLGASDITEATPEYRAKAGIGYVPQGRGIFPRLTTRENLMMGELMATRPVDEGYALVREFFPTLLERSRQEAGTLSGGEQQMLAIARVLVGGARILLLDEPSEGVQPSIVIEIAGRLQELNRRLRTTILFVEQNLTFIQLLASQCVVMKKGAVETVIFDKKIILSDSIMQSYLSL
jgi:ABC-type branched-subunit amino acid transport system ATPase component